MVNYHTSQKLAADWLQDCFTVCNNCTVSSAVTLIQDPGPGAGNGVCPAWMKSACRPSTAATLQEATCEIIWLPKAGCVTDVY